MRMRTLGGSPLGGLALGFLLHGILVHVVARVRTVVTAAGGSRSLGTR